MILGRYIEKIGQLEAYDLSAKRQVWLRLYPSASHRRSKKSFAVEDFLNRQQLHSGMLYPQNIQVTGLRHFLCEIALLPLSKIIHDNQPSHLCGLALKNPAQTTDSGYADGCAAFDFKDHALEIRFS